jgi:hypothetical protein
VGDIDTDSEEFQTALEEAVKEQVEGLKSKNNELLKKNRAAAKRLKEFDEKFGDVDPETYRELVTAHEEAQKKKAAAEGDFEQLREKLEARYTKELKEREERAAKLEQSLHDHLVNDALTEALVSGGIGKGTLSGARALLRERKPKVVEDGGEYRAVFVDDLGDAIPLKDYVGAWVKTDEATAYLEAAGVSGSESRKSESRSDKKPKVIPNDPLEIGRNAEAIAKGEMTVDLTPAA